MCVVGRDGSIAVVECKLASNGDRRRMVIGQVIDYAAAISMAGAGAFISHGLRNTQTDLRVELDNAALACAPTLPMGTSICAWPSTRSTTISGGWWSTSTGSRLPTRWSSPAVVRQAR